MNRVAWAIVAWVVALCGLSMLPAACNCPPEETSSGDCGGEVAPADCVSLQGVDFAQRCEVTRPGSVPVLVEACAVFSCDPGTFASDLVCDGTAVRLWCCE